MIIVHQITTIRLTIYLKPNKQK